MARRPRRPPPQNHSATTESSQEYDYSGSDYNSRDGGNGTAAAHSERTPLIPTSYHHHLSNSAATSRSHNFNGSSPASSSSTVYNSPQRQVSPGKILPYYATVASHNNTNTIISHGYATDGGDDDSGGIGAFSSFTKRSKALIFVSIGAAAMAFVGMTVWLWQLEQARQEWPSLDIESVIRDDMATYNLKIVGTYLHITDFHIDQFYLPGSTVGSYCHYNKGEGPKFKKKKKVKHPKWKAGYYGTPSTRCDSPYTLADVTLDFLDRSFAKYLDFVIWTGDNSRHDKDPLRPRVSSEVSEHHRYMFDKMRDLFINHEEDDNDHYDHNHHRNLPLPSSNSSHILHQQQQKSSSSGSSSSQSSSKSFETKVIEDPSNRYGRKYKRSIPVIFTLGNNDMEPHNKLAKPDKKVTREYFRTLLDIMGSDFIPADQQDTFLYGGYFAYPIPGQKLTVISLNAIYFSKANTKVGGCRAENSPGLGQLAWLRAQLREARKDDRSVIIIGHYIPNSRNYRKSCLNRYVKTVMEFKDVVKAQMFGHSNADIWNFIGQHSIPTVDMNSKEQWEIDVDEGRGILGSQIAVAKYIDMDAIDEWEGHWDNEIDETGPVEDDGHSHGNDDEDQDHHEHEQDVVAAASQPSNNDGDGPKNPPAVVEGFKKSYFREVMGEHELIIETNTPAKDLLVTTIAPSIIPRYQPGFKLIRYRRNIYDSSDIISEPIPIYDIPLDSHQRNIPGNQRHPHYNINKDGGSSISLSKDQRLRTNHYLRLPQGTILDYDVYWIDLKRVNRKFKDLKLPASPSSNNNNKHDDDDGDSDDIKMPDFRKLYRASDAYNLPDLTVPSYLKWAKSLLDKKHVRQMYKQFAFMYT
ncbi:Endopolyphosphatase [Mycoemilia scoparia]|uniref:Endopolyphosphatase n=1 Tax=Mycoemilia scoparia TaxID=417184 RepID=A0A9W8DLG1_9FUNG|nr:Endopolyphosphatase [Mycoemilia scoparia]